MLTINDKRVLNVFMRFIVKCIKQIFRKSISQHLYSAPSRYLLRGDPDPGQAEKNSLEKVVELRTGTVWEVP